MSNTQKSTNSVTYYNQNIDFHIETPKTVQSYNQNLLMHTTTTTTTLNHHSSRHSPVTQTNDGHKSNMRRVNPPWLQIYWIYIDLDSECEVSGLICGVRDD